MVWYLFFLGVFNSRSLSLSVFWASLVSYHSASLLLPQSQGSPYSMSGQRNVRALWANCKGEGRQNQVCVSQLVWYIQRKEPWNTKACWWVSALHCVVLHADVFDVKKRFDILYLCLVLFIYYYYRHLLLVHSCISFLCICPYIYSLLFTFYSSFISLYLSLNCLWVSVLQE